MLHVNVLESKETPHLFDGTEKLEQAPWASGLSWQMESEEHDWICGISSSICLANASLQRGKKLQVKLSILQLCETTFLLVFAYSGLSFA